MNEDGACHSIATIYAQLGMCFPFKLIQIISETAKFLLFFQVTD